MVNIFIRTLIIYILVIVVLRVGGKSEVGQMKPSEFVFMLLIADLAATPLADDNIPLFHGLMPILALLLGQMTISILTLKSRKMRKIFVGQPTILIRHGKIIQDELCRQRICVDDLLEQLRVCGYCDIKKIDTAVLEPSGNLSVFPWQKDEPLSASDIGLDVPQTGVCFTLIADGHLSHSNLKKSGHNGAWLEKMLKKHGAADIQDVLLLTVDECGGVYFQSKEAAS